MSTKKSKNNPQNRIKQHKDFCSVCNEIKKWVRYVDESTTKMATNCKCGVIDKAGTKVRDMIEEDKKQGMYINKKE